MFDTVANDNPNCWPLANSGGTKGNSQNRIFGMIKSDGPAGPQFNVDRQDLYGFFHGETGVLALVQRPCILALVIRRRPTAMESRSRPILNHAFPFAGWDYRGALYDYMLIGGKTSMVLKSASGVWCVQRYELSLWPQ